MTQATEAPVLAVNGTEIPPEVIAAEAQNHPSGNPDEAWSEAEIGPAM